MRIGIAGGIGSGKSYVCRQLQRRGITVYDCDSAAKRLIRTSTDIRRQLTALIGPDTYTAEGQLNKAAVAQFLLASEANTKAINDIVHPLEVRIRRVMDRDHITREKVLEWMAKQLPQEEVVRRADFEIVNDGQADIEQQLNKIIQQCNKPF